MALHGVNLAQEIDTMTSSSSSSLVAGETCDIKALMCPVVRLLWITHFADRSDQRFVKILVQI